VEARGKTEEMRWRSDDGIEEEHNVKIKMKKGSRGRSRDRVTLVHIPSSADFQPVKPDMVSRASGEVHRLSCLIFTSTGYVFVPLLP
jgi:hypothetical protein